jgi:hypothetical protein
MLIRLPFSGIPRILEKLGSNTGFRNSQESHIDQSRVKQRVPRHCLRKFKAWSKNGAKKVVKMEQKKSKMPLEMAL